jgi:very-short-patch-repair endonuclease
VLGVRSEVRVFGTADERIAAIAALQRGCIAEWQLRAAGIGRDAIRRRVRRGTLIRLHARVYAVGHLAAMPLRAETAAILAVRAGALLSHHTAAALWDLPVPRDSGEPVHLLVAGGSPGRRAGVRAHRTRRLDPRDVRSRHGLPVTSPARTLLDLADTLAPNRLARALDEARITGLVRPAQLRAVLNRPAGRHGAAVLRSLIDAEAEPQLTRSELEERMLALIRSADLPAPRVNQRLHGYEVDFHWPVERLVVEVDGFRFHSSRRAFERDRLKDARLRDHDVETLRVTWRQLDREPIAVAARLARALQRRAPH